MIELIYNEEENTTIEEKSLPEPKNVKQVGEPREYKKIFLEDYVYTFLQQYGRRKEQKICLAVLLGNSERSGGKRHLYLKSALPIEGVTERQGKYHFSEKIWGDIYQECEKYFPEQEILGWFLSRPGFAVDKNAVIEETHRTYFSGADKVFFLIEPLESDNAFFCFDGNRFTKQSGYYIYYEKNEPMREYLLEKNKQQKQAFNHEKPDIVMANFRKILKEKQERNQKRKKQAVSYGAKAAVVLAMFLVVVGVKNQTEGTGIPEATVWKEVEKEPIQQTFGNEVIIEDLTGDVESQKEEVEESEFQQEIPITEDDLPEENEAEPTEDVAAEVPVYEEYVVQAGDTLAKISRDFYGTDEKVDEICSLNGISDGDYIQAGEIILLP